MLVIIAQLKIGLIKNLIFLYVLKHFECARALAQIIVIGKKV